MKIAIFEADKECQEVFKDLDAHIDFYTEDINHALKSEQEYEAISIFIHSKITKEMLDLLPNLRYIQTRSTGFDHIDIDACKKRGIIVSNVKGYAGPTVSEFAFSLLLNITRKTYKAVQRTKEGNFYYKDLLGCELYGKTIAIIGLGTIGKALAKIAYGFGMHIKAYTRHFDEEFCQKLAIQKCSYPQILKDSDVIVFAVPLTQETFHMLSSDNVDLISDSAIVINVARGEIISLEALQKLQSRIFALGLDVIENEKELFTTKPSKVLKLIQQENLLYTPHMAYYTHEALQRIREFSRKNLKNFIAHKEIKNRVV